MKKFAQGLMIVLASGVVFQGACLPDNFWSGKWGEIVNGVIISFVNIALGAVSGGAVQV
jgi:hypothetical protein